MTPPSPICGIANGAVVVHVLPSATAKHLRDMAATLRAVEAHARALCICDGECLETRHGMMHGPCEARPAKSVAALAAYHAALNETVRVTRVERCAAVERAAKDAGDG